MTRGRLSNAAKLAPATVVIGVLFGGALLGALQISLQPVPGGLFEGLTVEPWRQVLTDPSFVDALVFSGRVTLLATVVSAALAVCVAGLLRRRGTTARALFSLPIPVPHLIVAVLAVVWLGSGGLVERLLGALPIQLVRDRAGLGITFVYVFKETPFLTLMVLSAWGPEVAEREEAAAVLGAGFTQRLRWVIWPAIRVPLAIGSLIVAAFVFGAFEVPLVVGPTYPPTVATFALDATRTADLTGQSRAAVALLVAAGVAVVLAVVSSRVLGRRR